VRTATRRERVALLFFLLCLAPPADARAGPPCAATIRELRALLADPAWPLRWSETTMDDGKPLVLSILERDGGLFLEFYKTGEGLWAEGAGVVCRGEGGAGVRFVADHVRFGPAANWVAQVAITTGSDFMLTRASGGELRIEASGWSGTFAPRDGE
jgi:hypothetical protein